MLRRIAFVVALVCASLGLSVAGASAEACPNEQLREENNSLSLPDCRAYELVSPPDQSGNDFQFLVGSVDGNHAYIGAIPPVLPKQSSGSAGVVIATRSSAGWRQQFAAPPGTNSNHSFSLLGFAEDGSRTFVQEGELSFLELVSKETSLLAIDGDGSRTTLLTSPVSNFFQTATLAGHSADARRVFIKSTGSLLPTDSHTQGEELYESDGANLRLVGLLPGGGIPPCGVLLANDTGGVNGTIGAGVLQNGLSADGQTVIFESPDPDAGCGQPVDLYLRRGGQTLDISAPTNGHADLGATYVGNSQDGSKVFFVTSSQLTPDDTDNNPDIYEYDVTAGTLTRITPNANIVGGTAHPNVTVSADGSHVYFIAENPLAGQGTAGQYNLFAWSGGTTTLIATVNPGTLNIGGPPGATISYVSPVTPDGSSFLFLTTARLTAYDNTDVTSGAPDQEVYRYSASDNSLTCVSCDPSGARPAGEARFSDNGFSYEDIQRYQSDDGHRVFFTSPDALVPQDVNGKYDVYEWHDGVVSLISGGAGPYNSDLAGASASGNDVFVMTSDRLMPSVAQDNEKLYDARAGGGFPGPLQSAPECSGSVCQGIPGSPPVFSAPSSATLTGSGNVAPAPATIAPKKTVKRAAVTCPRDNKRSSHSTRKRREHRKCVVAGAKSRKASAKRAGGAARKSAKRSHS